MSCLIDVPTELFIHIFSDAVGAQQDFDIGDQDATGSDGSKSASCYSSPSEHTDDSRPTASDMSSSESLDSESDENNDNPQLRYTRDEDTKETTLLSLSRKNLKGVYCRLTRKDRHSSHRSTQMVLTLVDSWQREKMTRRSLIRTRCTNKYTIKP